MTQTMVYSSRATLLDGEDPDVKPDWLDSLVRHAASKNKSLNISGILSYKNGKFMHVIEGEPEQLRSLFAQILDDDRHHNVFTLLDIKDSQRCFLDWGVVFEPCAETSLYFQDFLFAHFDDLVEMTEDQSDELLFFVDNVFNESCYKDEVEISESGQAQS